MSKLILRLLITIICITWYTTSHADPYDSLPPFQFFNPPSNVKVPRYVNLSNDDAFNAIESYAQPLPFDFSKKNVTFRHYTSSRKFRRTIAGNPTYTSGGIASPTLFMKNILGHLDDDTFDVTQFMPWFQNKSQSDSSSKNKQDAAMQELTHVMASVTSFLPIFFDLDMPLDCNNMDPLSHID